MANDLWRIGYRASYRGNTVILQDPANFLREERWNVRWRVGNTPTGWSQAVAPVSALTNLDCVTWEVGEEITVGFSPNQKKGTILSIRHDDGQDRKLYMVQLRKDYTKSWDEGPRLIEVGAENIETSILS